MIERITLESCNDWLSENSPTSVSIVCMDGYGDAELAKVIKAYNSSIQVHLFEPGTFLQADAAMFEVIVWGRDDADQQLSKLDYGEFMVFR